MQANSAISSTTVFNDPNASFITDLTSSNSPLLSIAQTVEQPLLEKQGLLRELQTLWPHVMKYCLGYLKHREDAEEACQDTMLNAIRAIDSFQWKSSLKTWLMKIAYHVCSAYYRNNRFRLSQFEELDETSLITTDIDNHNDTELHKAVAALSVIQRDILECRFVQEMSLNDIAISLGLTLSCVKMNYYRALDKVQKSYKRD